MLVFKKNLFYTRAFIEILHIHLIFCVSLFFIMLKSTVVSSCKINVQKKNCLLHQLKENVFTIKKANSNFYVTYSSYRYLSRFLVLYKNYYLALTFGYKKLKLSVLIHFYEHFSFKLQLQMRRLIVFKR